MTGYGAPIAHAGFERRDCCGSSIARPKRQSFATLRQRSPSSTVATNGVEIDLPPGDTHATGNDSRRSAIAPTIGHLKTDVKLDRNCLRRTLGDAMHEVLRGAGHDLRTILRKLPLLCAFVLATLLNHCVAAEVLA